MAQTFDIRFARTAGIAALLEVPENRFRWKGGGVIKIDAQGINIGLKRGLLALLGGQRTQRIPTENLRAVYREGDALRVEFQAGSAHVVLPFWADNRETAAQIVRLLPTSQTVEIEHSTGDSEPRSDWRVLLSLGVALAVLTMGIWAFLSRTQAPPASVAAETVTADSPSLIPMPDATAALTGTPEPRPIVAALPVEAATPAPEAKPDFLEPPLFTMSPPGPLPLPRDYVRSADFVIPIARGTAAYDVGRRELTNFERDATQLETDYRLQRDLLNASAVGPEEFAARLEEFEIRWWDLTFRIFENDALADPALLDLRASMLAAARLWRDFLGTYAKGMRARDHQMMASAFDELARAQEMQSRARLYLR